MTILFAKFRENLALPEGVDFVSGARSKIDHFVLISRQEGKELKLKQAEANHALGEISMELGKFSM